MSTLIPADTVLVDCPACHGTGWASENKIECDYDHPDFPGKVTADVADEVAEEVSR